jgi:integrase
MAKLNDTEISKLKWDETKRTASGRVPLFQHHNDVEVGGLHIRIYPPKAGTGRSGKVFYVKFGSAVNRSSYRIGAWGEWTLADARVEARRICKDFFDSGVNPIKAKQKRIHDAKGRLTVEELTGVYLREREPVWSGSYTRNNRLHAKRLVAACGAMYAEELTKDDVAPIFLRIKQDAPSQAYLFRAFGKVVFDWAVDWKRVPEMPNPFVLERGSSSAKSQYKIHHRARTRHLRYKMGEATQLFDLLKEYDSQSKPGVPSYLTIVKLYLLTGWRWTELREARYEDIDHVQRTIRNVDPKGGEHNAYTMPLTAMGYELLESLGGGHIRFRTGPIFPGRDRDEEGNLKPLTKWHSWYRVICKDARMPVCPTEGRITIHDLRRTSITWLQDMDFTVEERTIFKGSKPSGLTEGTYSQADRVDIRRRCCEAIEARIRDIENRNERSMFDQKGHIRLKTYTMQWRTPKKDAGSV